MILDLFVARREGTHGFTGGHLYINQVFECFSLEDEVREVPGAPVSEWKIKGQTAIPKGRYRIIISKSPRLGYATPEILNVPGYTAVRMHAGNTAKDTEGCILVGDEDPSDGFMGKSRKAYDRVFGKINEAINTGGEVWITLG